MTRKRLLAAVLATGILLSGCDSDRLTQFGNFAGAGTAYVATFHTLSKETGAAFIAADSAYKISQRPPVTPPAAVLSAQKFVQQDDAVLRKYLADLQTLDAHADLLGAYFAQVTQLTDGKASAATVTSLNSLVDSINVLNPKVEKVSFFGKGVKDYLGAAAGLAIAHFEVKALDRHLFTAAPVLDRALALQQAAVALMADQLKSSLSASLQAQELTKVLTPYTANAPLPPSWAADRDAFLRQSALVDSADSAQSAIKDLRTDFETLVQDRNARINWKSLFDEISKMTTYSSAAQAANKS